LFPDSFEDSELGKIPKGWNYKKLGEIIELAYGKPLKQQNRVPGEYPVFGSNGVIGAHNEFLVSGPGIIVGRKGNPGTVEWSNQNFFPIDTTFYVIPKQKRISLKFLYFALREQNLPHLSADSAVPGLNRNHAYLNLQLIPSMVIENAFEIIAKPLFKRFSLLHRESLLLEQLRNSLLPKLISGELRIKDTEKYIEEAGI